MSDVYVLGVDMIKFGRFPERTVPDLGAEAALLALDIRSTDEVLRTGGQNTKPYFRRHFRATSCKYLCANLVVS